MRTSYFDEELCSHKSLNVLSLLVWIRTALGAYIFLDET